MMNQSPKAPFRLIADYVVPGDGTAAVIKDGAVDIDSEGRIAAVGPATSLGEPTGDVADVGGLLMPGLVNAHAHGPMTLVRSAGDGLPLMRWLQEGVWPREGKMAPDDAYVGMQLASCDLVFEQVHLDSRGHSGQEHFARCQLHTYIGVVGCHLAVSYTHLTLPTIYSV